MSRIKRAYFDRAYRIGGDEETKEAAAYELARMEYERNRGKRLGSEPRTLTPDDVVDAAADESSPLHGFFEWNDRLAAREYRIGQARQLLRAVRIVYDEKKPPIRFVPKLQYSTTENGYTNSERAMAHPETRESVIRGAYGGLVAWKRRYGELVEFARIAAEIDEIDIDEIIAESRLVAA